MEPETVHTQFFSYLESRRLDELENLDKKDKRSTTAEFASYKGMQFINLLKKFELC